MTRDRPPSQACLHTDLALVRDEIKRLRAHTEHLRAKLRRSLGTQLDNLTRTDLVARIDEITDHNTACFAETHQLHGHNNELVARSPNYRTTSPPPAPACAE
jgi:hypothetical protein